MPIERPKGRYMLMNVFDAGEIRIAICEGESLSEFYLERSQDATLTGNIYKGRVENIVPSLQSAFVNIGEQRNGFLHISDVIFPDGGYRGLLPKRRRKPGELQKRDYTIDEVLYAGQELLVQVTKEGIGQKGPALTTYLSMPGRYLVLMPALHKKGVSRRIEDEEIRKRLKDALNKIVPGKEMGVIVRTAGESVGAEHLEQDLKYLNALWEAIKRTVKAADAPALVYQESDLVLRAVRDIFTDDMTKCLIDEDNTYRRVAEFIRAIMPSAANKIEFFDKRVPIFDFYGIEEQVLSLSNRRIPLSRGASLVIDQTEALVAIDVNTGKLKEESMGETLLQTNLIAAKEIVHQIMLRDLAGLIVIDFIDMENPAHRKQLFDEFNKHLAKDKARKSVSELSEFCVMQMTRQRKRASLGRAMYTRCPTCDGRGLLQNTSTIALSLMRKIRKGMAQDNVVKIEAVVHHQLALLLLNERRREISKLEDFYNCGVTVTIDNAKPLEETSVIAHLENGEKLVIS